METREQLTRDAEILEAAVQIIVREAGSPSDAIVIGALRARAEHLRARARA